MTEARPDRPNMTTAEAWWDKHDRDLRIKRLEQRVFEIEQLDEQRKDVVRKVLGNVLLVVVALTAIAVVVFTFIHAAGTNG